MTEQSPRSEIRDSIVRELIEKVRKRSYGQYLVSMRLERIRLFEGGVIDFDFPVTALIGPNGGGKSTVLGAAACIYDGTDPHKVFRKSRVGDDTMNDWRIEYELVDRTTNPKGSVRADLAFANDIWNRSGIFIRPVKSFGITRTVPASENQNFAFRRKLSANNPQKSNIIVEQRDLPNIESVKREAERILGNTLAEFRLIEATISTFGKKALRQKKKRPKTQLVSEEVQSDGTIITIRKSFAPAEAEAQREPTLPPRSVATQLIYVGANTRSQYSEFHFGSGESSVIRMVADIEELPNGSLVLIEEIENGLHPLAVRRMVEYLIDVSNRKGIQCLFTTHSDYALVPLPSEGIWAAIDGRLQQGKLSVEVLRAVSGRVDKQVAVFVEDEFAKTWLEAVLREKLSERFEQVGVYAVFGDGNAVKVHVGHANSPATTMKSACYLDGDSEQADDVALRVFRLPGGMPESTVFDDVLKNMSSNIALLTAACQRPQDKQDKVAEIITDVSRTNRDPHLLFNQIGIKLGFVPEAIVRGALLSVWIQENEAQVESIHQNIRGLLDS